jgi:hypothetical protein
MSESPFGMESRRAGAPIRGDGQGGPESPGDPRSVEPALVAGPFEKQVSRVSIPGYRCQPLNWLLCANPSGIAGYRRFLPFRDLPRRTHCTDNVAQLVSAALTKGMAEAGQALRIPQREKR